MRAKPYNLRCSIPKRKDFQTPPLDFDHLSRTPLAPSENSATPPPEFSADERPPRPPVTLAIAVDDRSLHGLRAQRA
jgi:hypothetical protein